jgi:hypothetical protein
MSADPSRRPDVFGKFIEGLDLDFSIRLISFGLSVQLARRLKNSREISDLYPGDNAPAPRSSPMKNRVLISILCLAIVLPRATFAAESIDPKAAEAERCKMAFVPEDRLESAIADALSNVAEAKDAGEAALLQKYAEKIAWRINRACAKVKGCTAKEILRAAIDESDRIIKRTKGVKRFTGYAKLATAMIVVTVVAGRLTSGIDSTVVNSIIGTQVGIVLGHLRAPIDALWETAFRKKSFQQVAETIEKSRAENAGFKASFATMQATYTGLERDGRGVLLGAQNDLTNHVIKLQNYLILNSVRSEVQANDEEIAKMFAAMLYESRIFHADAPPRNPQMLSIFRPTVSPLGPLYWRLKDRIAAAVEELELKEGRIEGNPAYDPTAAKKFYDELEDAWFGPPSSPL